MAALTPVAGMIPMAVPMAEERRKFTALPVSSFDEQNTAQNGKNDENRLGHAGGPHVFRAPGRRQQADAVCAHGAQSEQNKAADNVCWAFHAFPLSGFAAEYLGKGTARWERVCASRLRWTAPAVAGPLFACMPPHKQ